MHQRGKLGKFHVAACPIPYRDAKQIEQMACVIDNPFGKPVSLSAMFERPQLLKVGAMVMCDLDFV